MFFNNYKHNLSTKCFGHFYIQIKNGEKNKQYWIYCTNYTWVVSGQWVFQLFKFFKTYIKSVFFFLKIHFTELCSESFVRTLTFCDDYWKIPKWNYAFKCITLNTSFDPNKWSQYDLITVIVIIYTDSTILRAFVCACVLFW